MNPHVTAVCPPRPVTLTAADGTALSGRLYSGGNGTADNDLAFVLGHGFTNHIRKPVVRAVLERLAHHGPVLGLDFRGHGRSGGRSSVGTDEALDVTAAVRHLRSLGYARIATIGFSLGGSVVLRQAALGVPDDRPDAVVAVSSPARWWVRETPAMRRVHWLLEQPHGRWSARLLGVRLDRPWPEVPTSPIELVDRIDPIPTLFVHGDHDHYFPVSDAIALSEARGGELWLEPGMRHAESATSSALVDRVAVWAAARVASPGHTLAETEV
ncbi:alpha/beta hydrolase [Parasphingorhabdus pacifica]